MSVTSHVDLQHFTYFDKCLDVIFMPWGLSDTVSKVQRMEKKILTSRLSLCE